MILTILGSGTLASNNSRNPAGYLLKHGKEYAMLDFGPGILKQLKQISASLLYIDTIFLSHFHLDHCADVFPFLLNRYLLDEDSKHPIRIIGPRGLHEWFSTLEKLQGDWMQRVKSELIECSGSSLFWAGMEVTARANGHTENSIAYLFRGERSFFCSGDMDFEDSLIPFAKDADTGLIECSLPDDGKRVGHLTPSETGRFAAEAGIRKLIVTHIYPQNDTADLKDRLSHSYSGVIEVAEDFMEIIL